jgi:hypothetical protein
MHVDSLRGSPRLSANEQLSLRDGAFPSKQSPGNWVIRLPEQSQLWVVGLGIYYPQWLKKKRQGNGRCADQAFGIMGCAHFNLSFGRCTANHKMKSNRRTAVIVGVLFIVGTVAGILSGVFTGPVLGAADVLMKVPGNENQIVLGALIVLVMGFSRDLFL